MSRAHLQAPWLRPRLEARHGLCFFVSVSVLAAFSASATILMPDFATIARSPALMSSFGYATSREIEVGMGGGAVRSDFKDRNIPGLSPLRHQPPLLGPAQPLDGRLPLQGR
jgi:hypothetical protein